ncbi:hypothetical protein B0J11DRAFT_540530 [Dendryphion nanum]|uniref:G-patch domain-containing protein n=1 Tax=Dendryphion nanum TaxID=256645 RepID=A0A9P9D801_9PLEO|nr:hypothetical protein B0J11DRAFT_540530 [Dendryphion nanum]
MSFKRPRANSPSGAQKRSRGAGVPSNNIKLGTELPPEDDNDDGSFVPVWKQTVTDERGRRRLHGAFTGGFSAGYFNTVGSKEGWTPKTFVSSRANRNKDESNGPTQRPEDFMDEEDLAQAAESRQLETAQSFAGIGDSSKSSTNDGFFGLFMTEEDTIGVKIIQKMGWRRDQGIGRKVHRSAQLGDLNGASKDEQTQHFFAPKDSRAMPLVQQEFRKGLGFQSEGRLSKDEQEPNEEPKFTLPFLEKSKKPTASQKPSFKKSSFGVGVLNDTGSDDEDPYELGPKISFNKTLGKDKKAKKQSKFSKASGGDRHVFVSKKGVSAMVTSVSLTSRDGRPVLRGFRLAIRVTMQPKKMKYPPPQMPSGWKSIKGVTQNPDPSTFQSVADAARSSTLDVKDRASLLGETPLPGKSVFDFISKENRDRIAVLTGRADLPQGQGQAAPQGHKSEGQKDLWSFVPILDKNVAAGALAKGATGWMPYAEDLKKRARYVSFLELKTGVKHSLPERAPGLSVSDWVNEMKEFAQAADVFKPTSGIMASRFTSSSSAGPQTGGDNGKKDLLRTPATKPEDPAEQAAMLGMYGPMTRSVMPFHPTRLLCKRFNVPPPPDVPLSADTDADIFGARTREAVSKSDLNKMMHEVLTRGPALQRPSWMNQPKETGMETDTLPDTFEHAKVDIEHNEALLQERPPEDIFKAIFGDDDDDDE